MNDTMALIESITRYLGQGRPFISILSPADDLLLQARDTLLGQKAQLQQVNDERDLAQKLLIEQAGSREKIITTMEWW